MEDGLSNEQTEKILQFQDITGIEDMNICRDVLIRHQWDLEVAFQEQMNIREGIPTTYAASRDVRAPAVIDDRFLQQIFSANMPGGRSARGGMGPIPRSFTGIIGYVINMVFQYCYSTFASVLNALLSLGRNDERIVTDPVGDVMSFIRSYNERYPSHPVFYQGTYAQALNDAKQELRFLLIYLHKDPTNNPDVDSLCRTTLSNQSVIDFVNRNMLFWGCDVSSPEGYRVSHTLNMHVYPTMVLIALRNNRMVVVGRFEGDCMPEELTRRMQTVISANEIWLSQARADRLERNLTQTLRQQQDEAYQLSLRADEEKERLRQLERDAVRQAEEAIERERAEEARKKEEIAQLKIELADLVPNEPPAGTADAISVVFKLPNGARLERRFLNSNSLIDVYNYLFCHPSSPDEFEITTNFPKRVLYASSSNSGAVINGNGNQTTLAEAGLKHREVLFVNDLEA
ncbi:FAS-associated factor 2 [Zeugodacus cucurbitae]|uniref:FAS-associated factor 2-B n=1 Tax=Zeugodacus cucurbitae TaxID=28588 RepID=A0A0A1WWA7_ZEUCU|nr:FAS-associated factor 2 [Zeugodacus cucurbitae]